MTIYNQKLKSRISVLLLLLFTVVCRIQLTIPPVLSSNMVFQLDNRLPIWVTATPGERIAAVMESEETSTLANGKRNWKVESKPRKTSKTRIS